MRTNPGRAEQIDRNGFPGERREGLRADKLRGAVRHDDFNVGAALNQPSSQVGGLVGGNASRYCQKDPATLQHCSTQHPRSAPK